MRELVAIDLGTLDLAAARERQLERLVEVQADAAPDTVFLLEHPEVITLGRAQRALGNVLDAGDVPVVELERGGDATYHAPGQLVAYPIVKLVEDAGERDLHRYLRALEAAVIETCGALGLAGTGRRAGATGVWCGAPDAAGLLPRKLCSIGIACRKWVCFHGLALNVDPALAGFARLRPCGFDAQVMTSVAHELGRAVPMAEAKRALVDQLRHALGRRAPG